MQIFPPLLYAPVFAVAFFGLYLALGRRCLALARIAPSGLYTLERVLLETTVGIGVIQVFPIGLAVFGALSAFSVRVAILLLALVLAPDLWAAARDLNGAIQRLRKRALTWPVLTWVGLLSVLLAVLLVHALFLGFTDDDGYHLAAPWRWLREGTLSYLPSYTHTNAGLGFEMSYLIALAFDSVLGAKLLHYGTGILTLVATLACARRLGAWAIGATAVSLLMITTPLVATPFLFTVAYADFPACLAVMVGILLWIVWRETHEKKLLWSIALCAGFTASFKFTAVAALAAWGVLIALELRGQGRRLGPGCTDIAKFGLIAVAPTLPWFARNWLLTGNPVYPMAASLIRSRDWTLEQGAVFSQYIKFYSWGVASGSSMGLSTRQLLVVLTAVGVVTATALSCWFVKDRRLRMMLCFAAVYILICVSLTGLLLRYWLPGIICVLLGVCTAAATLWSHRYSLSSLRYMPAIALLLVALGVQARQEIQKGLLLRDLRVATGVSTHAHETADDTAEQTWRFMRTHTAADSRFLVAAFYSKFGASSFGCFRAQRHCFTTDSHLQTYIDFKDWPAFLASVEKAGVQYVLLPVQEEAPNRQGFTYAAREHEFRFCVDLARTAGVKVFEAGPFQIYKIVDLEKARGSP